MVRPLHKAIILIISIFITISIAGCEEEQLSNTRQNRLVVAKLKEQLRQCKGEKEKQEHLHNKQTAEQNELLGKCQESKIALEEKIQHDIPRQQEKHKKLMQQQKALLEKCQEHKSVLEKRKQEDVQGQITEFTRHMVDKTAKLVQRNRELNSKIKQLKKELEELKKSNP